MAGWTKTGDDRWEIEQRDGGRSYLLRDGGRVTELHVPSDGAPWAHHFVGSVGDDDEWPLGAPGEDRPEGLGYVTSIELPDVPSGADPWETLRSILAAEG